MHRTSVQSWVLPSGASLSLARCRAVLRRSAVLLVLALVAFALTCAVYSLIGKRILTDFSAHARDARQAMRTLQWPPHFLYFLTVGLLSLFTSGTESAFEQVSLLVLAGAVSAKLLISAFIVRRELAKDERDGLATGDASGVSGTVISVGLFLLLFAHSLPRTPLYYLAAGLPRPTEFSAYCFYAGRATSSIWHNSTIVFSMPFVLLLFHESAGVLRPVPVLRPFRLLGLTALVAAAKPSFLLAMAPVLPLLALYWHRLTRAFWLACAAVAFALLLLVIQRYWITRHVPTGYGVAIAFLRVWGPYAPCFPLDLLGSYLYPLLFAILFPSQAGKQRLYLYAAALSSTATLIGMTLCEMPPFTSAGNFMWQVHTCCFLWFFATFLCQVNALRERGHAVGWRDVVLFSCLGLHVVNGVAYLVRSLVTCTFM